MIGKYSSDNYKEKTFIFVGTDYGKLAEEKDKKINEFKKTHKCKASIINALESKYGGLIIIETIFYEGDGK